MTQTLYDVLMVLFLIIAVLLILVILVQRGRGGGLVGAFGGPGGSSAFGAKTGDVFTVITVVMAALFLIIGCLLAFRPAPPTFVEPPTPIESTTGTADESAQQGRQHHPCHEFPRRYQSLRLSVPQLHREKTLENALLFGVRGLRVGDLHDSPVDVYNHPEPE